ncbi:general stress protein [Hymenobacter convexus]|uniref:general stress protein n=1 Tax=Hymenobacter sp. CA1UV-4 TaxID=3063782 RepID=UPI002712EFFC|nr:general stress protein [Hymenobacter sp. CA1UV-4]MDO7852520.1 general stress protein [Hymenobacter sp. CA1UV-4]
MKRNETVVAVYDTHQAAESAVRELQQDGYDMRKLSIIGADYQTEEKVLGFYTTGQRMKSWGGVGAFWGSIWGMLLGSALFILPGMGPLLMAGPVVLTLVSALEGALVVGGASALVAALVGLGIPEHAALHYEVELKAGKFLLLAHGTAAEVEHARELLQQPVEA